MATDQITLTATKGARIYGNGTGAGASDQLPVGLYSGDIYRALVQFANPDYTGLDFRQLTKAVLRLRNSGPTTTFVVRGSTPRLFIRRITEAWSEGSSSSLSTSNAVTWANQPNTTTTLQKDSGTLSTTMSATVDIDITSLFGQFLPTTVKRADGTAGGGSSNYGIQLRSFDETTTSRTTEFFSDDIGTAAARPQLILTFITNSAPKAPTLTTPIADADGNAAVAPMTWPTSSTRTITFAGTRNDPDPGDYITGVQVQVFADTATDATPGTAIVDSTKAITGSPTSFSVAIDVTGLTAGTTYRARVRTQDHEGTWGAWSSLTTSRFRPNTVPSPPSNLAQDANTQTPNFYGSLVDRDAGATISEVRIVVEQATSTGTVTKWDSGWTASGGTRFAIAYGGTTLDFGTGYRWYAFVRDNIGSESGQSATATWTPTALTGPTGMSPITVETKQNSLTPTLTVGNGGAFTNHELQVAKYGDGTGVMWAPVVGTAYASTTTKAVVYAGAALTWGRIHYWRARVLVGGVTWSEWSPWYPFYVDALPDAPKGTVDGAASSGTGIYGDYVTIPTLTPTLRFPFSDPDIAKGYTEAATRREIQIVRADTGAAATGSPFVTTSGITDTYTVGAGVLTGGVTYKARARHQDNASQFGDWSGWVLFKVQSPLTIAANGTADPTDPTPTLAWTPSRSQRAFRLLIFQQATGDLIYDSGLVMSSQPSWTIPGYILGNITTYRWTVTAYDADMLPATLA